jgi:hypothetical protein
MSSALLDFEIIKAVGKEEYNIHRIDWVVRLKV